MKLAVSLFVAMVSLLGGACVSLERPVPLPQAHPARPGTPRAFEPVPDPFAVDPTYGLADVADAHEGHGPSGVATDATGDQVLYTCPMHPEVVRSAPGSCPECGMTLHPMEAPAHGHDHAREGSER